METTLQPDTPLGALEWLGKRQLSALQDAGMHTLGDLLDYSPRRYEDRKNFWHEASQDSGREVCVRGTVTRAGFQRGARGGGYFEITLEDEHSVLRSRVQCRWFNARYLSKVLASGQKIIVFGKIKLWGSLAQMMHPEFEILEDDDRQELNVHLNRIVPIYRSIANIAPRRFRELMFRLVQALPQDYAAEYGCLHEGYSRYRALVDLHFPASMEDLQCARAYLAFEECYLQQLLVQYRRQQYQGKTGVVSAAGVSYFKRMRAGLPFELSDSQLECLRCIYRDMQSPQPMHRLLQGDVGAGKTLVALAAMLFAVESGHCAVLMAPTQILAEQHYRNACSLLQGLDLKIALVTANTNATSAQLQGSDILIGTHALLYGCRELPRLGLLVIDEQHKFGVEQRNLLMRQTRVPDVLVMSATPIPRTLTMSYYGDLDVSILQRPAGREANITTVIRTKHSLGKLLDFLKQRLGEGQQCYIVYPLVEESQKHGKVAALSQQVEFWQQHLQQYGVEFIHGKLPAKQKEQLMLDFKQGRFQVLLATSVIEVGIDVPKANIMIINNAERFGLAQLHQLRGRIGRGGQQAWCVLFSELQPQDEQYEKLQVMQQHLDGFKLAEEDLRLRGPGELLGTAQSGQSDLRYPEWVFDAGLIARAKDKALQTLQQDPELQLPEQRYARRFLQTALQRQDDSTK